MEAVGEEPLLLNPRIKGRLWHLGGTSLAGVHLKARGARGLINKNQQRLLIYVFFVFSVIF